MKSSIWVIENDFKEEVIYLYSWKSNTSLFLKLIIFSSPPTFGIRRKTFEQYTSFFSYLALLLGYPAV